MTKIKCSKIKYDTDGEDIKLPTSMTIEMDDDEYACAKEEIDDLEEEIGDIISDRTGFCVTNFEYTIK